MGKDLLSCIQKLSKHIEPGEVTAAGEKNQLEQLMRRQQEQGQVQALLRQRQAQGQTPPPATPPAAAA